MRLLNARTKKLEVFDEGSIHPYAVLSHTWGSDEEEVTFQDVQDASDLKPCLGRSKLDGCCAQAVKDGLGHVWIDTCCIDKANSTELGEAINSMFRWYRQADRCYAYLSDVPPGDRTLQPQSAFCQSRWFTRGWTLQELLAPRVVHFFDKEWNKLGDKRALSSGLVAATGIDRHFLLGMVDLHEASVAQRMSWAARRATKRTEDLAYCLLGIFDVNLPMIYGEGERAFRRLQEEILRTCQDDSILAWGFSSSPPAKPAPSESRSTSVFADSPARFAQCGHIVPTVLRADQSAIFSIAGGNLSMQRKLYKPGTGHQFVVLECYPKEDSTRAVCIPVSNSTPQNLAVGVDRLDVLHSTLLPRDHKSQVETVRIRLDPTQSSQAFSKQCLVSVDNSVADVLKISDVVPRACWNPAAGTIMSPDGTDDKTRRLVVRFRPTYKESHDIALLLDIGWKGLNPQVTLHVVTCSQRIENGHGFGKLKSNSLGNHGASIGQLNVVVKLKTEQLGRKSILEVQLASKAKPQPTVDVTLEAERPIALRNLEANLRQDHTLCVQLAGMATDLKSETKVLKSKEEALKDLDKRIRNLQEERSALLAKIQSTSATKTLLSSEVAEKASRREELARNINHGLDSMTRGGNESSEKTSPDEWPSSIIRSLSKWLPPTGHPAIDALPKGPGKLMLSAIRLENFTLFQLLARLGVGAAMTDKTCNGLVTKTLVWAACHGRGKVFSALLEMGASVDGRDASGMTPLAHAVEQGNNKAIQLLLENGADHSAHWPSPSAAVEKQRPQTPLGLAACRGDEASILALLRKGANVESRGPSHMTPLAWAALNDREAAVRVLLQEGANIESENMGGSTPLLVAASQGANATIKLLLDRGAKINAKCSWGTPLSCAASRGLEASVKILLSRGADVNAKSPKGRPLTCAASSGKDACIKLLLDHGANINKRSPCGTPLMCAASAGHEACVKILLDGGADMTIRDDDRKTAFGRAVLNGHRRSAQVLLDHGEQRERELIWSKARALFNLKEAKYSK